MIQDRRPDADARAQGLAALMQDPDPLVRKSCVVALGKMEGPQATDVLCGALADVDEGVRVLACQALGRKEGAQVARSLPALLDHVHDGSREVRSGILWVLANAAAHGDLDEPTRRALFIPVTVMAFDPDDGVRADAAAVLGTLRDERATDALSVLLEDAVPRVRANAASSLALSDDAAGEDLLLGRLEDAAEAPIVKVAALDAAARRAERGGMAGARPLAAALALAADPDPDVAATAVWALGHVAAGRRVPDEVYAVLDHALSGGEEWAARYAAESLARLHDERARLILEGAPLTGRPFAEALGAVVAEALATF